MQILYDFKYSWPGPNTALLENYLGPTEPEWEGRWYLSSGYAGQDERVNRRSIIREADLLAILAMLPSDEARRRVLVCVTTPQNLARVHQGLLLVSLKSLGYPQGYDAERWWRKHKPAFRVIDDPAEAARMVLGWRNAIQCLAEADSHSPSSPDDIIWRQLDAAYLQEMGMWGGDGDFSEAYYLASISPQPPSGAGTVTPTLRGGD